MAMCTVRHSVLAVALWLMAGQSSVMAQGTSWQDAVARLAQERTLAETCARVLKKYGTAAAQDRGSIAYGEAKASFDGAIAGLVVALAQKQQPESIAHLQDRLERGYQQREAFCEDAAALIPSEPGQKGIIDEIVSGALGPLIQAAKDIYFRGKDDDALTRRTIQTQLEATTWPAFASVSPSP